jgi:hypothetical protein
MTIPLGRIQPLRELLIEIGKLKIDEQEAGGWLFLPRDKQWTLESPAVLLELNEVPPGTENVEEVATPELAKRETLKRILLGVDVQGIIDNVRQQMPDADLDDIWNAVLHYYEFDAYKDMSEPMIRF